MSRDPWMVCVCFHITTYLVGKYWTSARDFHRYVNPDLEHPLNSNTYHLLLPAFFLNPKLDLRTFPFAVSTLRKTGSRTTPFGIPGMRTLALETRRGNRTDVAISMTSAVSHGNGPVFNTADKKTTMINLKIYTCHISYNSKWGYRIHGHKNEKLQIFTQAKVEPCWLKSLNTIQCVMGIQR